MKVGLWLVLSVLMLCASSNAQDRVELFGGYSRTGYSVFAQYSGPWVSAPFNGWEVSGAYRVAPHLQLEGDFAWGYSPSNHWSLHTFMAGPRVSMKFSRIELFGHALIGSLTFNNGGLSQNSTSVAGVVGGGADLWLTRHVGARLIQVDYLRNNNDAAVLGFEHGAGLTGPGNTYRLATGITFRFGH